MSELSTSSVIVLPVRALTKIFIPSKTQDKVECGLLLDVIVGQSTTVLKLLSCEDQPLLVRRDPFLILDLGLHVLGGV